MLSTPRPPDVLVVVLDCVSAMDYVGGSDPVDSLPVSSSLARESIIYSKAVAPASWTVPSHYSMFSGGYPWQNSYYSEDLSANHGAAAFLAEHFRAMGYKTASFSANPHVGTGFGLSRGIDHSEWGDFSDCSMRKLTRWYSAHHTSADRTGAETVVGSIPRFIRTQMRRTVLDIPIAADVLTRTLARMVGLGANAGSFVAPWIEPSVERWLSGIDASVPTYCFVNLLDAHEAYIGLPSSLKNPDNWFEFLTFSQRCRDRAGRPVLLSPERAFALRSLYRQSIGLLDQRLETIIQIYMRLRNWDNTIVVITSDHGQSFTPFKSPFHISGGVDSVHRVPLIVKPIVTHRVNNRIDSWTSLTKLPSIIDSAGLDGVLRTRVAGPGAAVIDPGDLDQPIALSLSEEIPSAESLAGGQTVPEDLRNTAVVGYCENFRVVVNASSLEVETCTGVTSGVMDPIDVDSLDREASGLTAAVRNAALLVRAHGSTQGVTAVSKRIADWGY